MLLYFASREEVDVEALVARSVKEQLAQAQAELTRELDLREKQHDRELEERWTKEIQGAEARVLAEQQRQQELENERRQAEQREQEERRAKELEEKERQERKKKQEEEEKRKLEAEKKKQEQEEQKLKLKDNEEEEKKKAEPVAAEEKTEEKFTPEGIPYLSSLPPLQPVPNERLDSLLKSRASTFAVDGQPKQTGQDIILVVFNKGYVELLSNLLCTLRRLDLLPHVVGIALDEEALAECPGMGVECVLPAAPFLRAASASFHYHGNDDFKSLSKLKSRNVLEVLLRGYNVLLVDGDIVFFRNPLPILRNGSGDFDLQIQSDSPHGRPKNAYLNSGLYYVAANQRSIDFLSVLWEFGRTTAANVSEQVTFSRLIDRMQVGKAPGLRLRRNNLELHEFCNGDSYFSPPPEGANGVYAIRPDASDHCYVLHFNWIYGGNKLKTMKGNKFWFVDDAGQC